MAQIDIWKLRRAPGQRRPRLKEWVSFLVEAVEMVSYPQTVKLRSYRRQNMFALILHDGLKIAPPVANYRRQPPKFGQTWVFIHTDTSAPSQRVSRVDGCSPAMLILATSTLNGDEAFPKAKGVRPRLAITKHDVLIAAKNSSDRRKHSRCS